MHTIEESLRHLQQVYQAVGNHPSSRDVLCNALGHKSVSGPAAVKVGAMSHFGLLRARKGGTYELTPLAERILMPRDDDEARAAIAEAARTPTLYTELLTSFAGKQVPRLLGNLLARQYGVAPKQADEFAERFRNSMEFAGLLRNGVLHSELPDSAFAGKSARGEQVDEIGDSNVGEPVVHDRSEAASRVGVPAVSLERTQEYTIPLGRDGKLAIIQLPVPVHEGYLKRIEAWAGYMRSVLEDDGGVGAEEPQMSP